MKYGQIKQNHSEQRLGICVIHTKFIAEEVALVTEARLLTPSW